MKDFLYHTAESAQMRLGQVTCLYKPEFLKKVKEKNPLHSLLKQERVHSPRLISHHLSFFFFFF